MTEEELLERRARRLCEMRGMEPDSSPTGHPTGYHKRLWEFTAEELRAWDQCRRVMSEDQKGDDDSAPITPGEHTTRDGAPARVFMTDGGGAYPILGAVWLAAVNRWEEASWTEAGGYTVGAQHPLDLMPCAQPLPERELREGDRVRDCDTKTPGRVLAVAPSSDGTRVALVQWCSGRYVAKAVRNLERIS